MSNTTTTTTLAPNITTTTTAASTLPFTLPSVDTIWAQIGTWYTDNKQISIPITVVVGLIVVGLLLAGLKGLYDCLTATSDASSSIFGGHGSYKQAASDCPPTPAEESTFGMVSDDEVEVASEI